MREGGGSEEPIVDVSVLWVEVGRGGCCLPSEVLLKWSEPSTAFMVTTLAHESSQVLHFAAEGFVLETTVDNLRDRNVNVYELSEIIPYMILNPGHIIIIPYWPASVGT